MWGSVPSSLFRWLVSLWIIQDSRRHRVNHASLSSINEMATRVCSARAEVAVSAFRTAL